MPIKCKMQGENYMVYSVKFTLKTSLEKGKKNADTVKVGRLKKRIFVVVVN